MNTATIEPRVSSRRCVDDQEWGRAPESITNRGLECVSEIGSGDIVPLTSLDLAVAKAMGCVVRLFAVPARDGKGGRQARVRPVFIAQNQPSTEEYATGGPSAEAPTPYYVRIPLVGRHDILGSCLRALHESGSILAELAVTRSGSSAGMGNLTMLMRPCLEKDIDWLLERLGRPPRAVTAPVWVCEGRKPALPIGVLAR